MPMDVTQHEDGRVVFDNHWSAYPEEFTLYDAAETSDKIGGYYALSERPGFGAWEITPSTTILNNPEEFDERRGLYIYRGSDISEIEHLLNDRQSNRTLTDFNE